MDTSTFTHFCRAHRHDILRRLAPQGLILIPDAVSAEVRAGRESDYEIPDLATLPWVEVGVLTPAEEHTQLLIKVDMPSASNDGPAKNLGECAVLACAQHRGMVAVIDDSDARSQARARGLRFVTSMWIIAEHTSASTTSMVRPRSNSTRSFWRPICGCPGSTVSSAGRTRWASCRTVVVDQSRRACRPFLSEFTRLGVANAILDGEQTDGRVTSIDRYVLVTTCRAELVHRLWTSLHGGRCDEVTLRPF